jgi:hypothetical protein
MSFGQFPGEGVSPEGTNQLLAASMMHDDVDLNVSSGKVFPFSLLRFRASKSRPCPLHKQVAYPLLSVPHEFLPCMFALWCRVRLLLIRIFFLKKRANAFIRKLYEIVTSNTGLCGFGEAEGVFVILDETVNVRRKRILLVNWQNSICPNIISCLHRHTRPASTSLEFLAAQ